MQVFLSGERGRRCEVQGETINTLIIEGGKWYGYPCGDGVRPMWQETVEFFSTDSPEELVSQVKEWAHRPNHTYWNGQRGSRSYTAQCSVICRWGTARLNGAEIPNPVGET